VNSEIHLEAVICELRVPWRPRCSQFSDALVGHDYSNWEGVIERAWMETERLRSSELTHGLGGRNRTSLEMELDYVIEPVKRCPWMT
jgi:hypothetical protein